VAPSPTSPTSSTSLPREAAGFRLVRELGRGGMGIVYEAEEISSGRRVALKVLLADLTVSEVAYERFQREARLAAAISHAHCVFVYGAHQVEGSPAIAMEMVDGETLEHRIAGQEPISIETAVKWTIDLIDGLEAAHKSGVLHRDVKPSNCFVTSEGRVKVGDFGLSRTLELDVNLTQTGQFLGSPLYASPEQVRGRALDVRSDLYSCAATLYAILTRRAPHSGSNVGEVLARILSEAPEPPSAIRPEVPKGLDRAVLRAMSRDPEERYSDLAEFREALAPFAKTDAGVAARWRRIVAYLVDSAVLSLMGMGMLALQRVLGLSWFPFSADAGNVNSVSAEMAIQGMSLVYFWVGEGCLGTTLGKWIFGLRVVSSATRERTVGGAAVRGLVFQAPGIAIRFATLLFVSMPVVMALFASIGPFIGLLLLFSTARRRNGWRGVHELLSGTVVAPAGSPFRRSRLATAPPEFALQPRAALPERVGEYAIEGVVAATPDGQVLKGRDSTLARSVWIQVPTQPGALANESRRSLSRQARLRWLGTLQMPDGVGDVYESPGGTSLPAFVAGHPVLEWWRAHQLLTELVAELRFDASRPHGLALEQVWIDRNWNLRLLDQPIGNGPFVRHADLALVREAARALFQGVGPAAQELPRDLPGRAEPVVRRLLGEGEEFRSLEAIARELKTLDEIPTRLQRRTRVAQLSLSAFGPAACLLFAAAVMTFLSPLHDITANLSPLTTDRSAREAKSIVGVLTEEERAAHEILLLEALEDPFGKALLQQMEKRERDMIDEIRARHPTRTPADIAAARHVVTTGPGGVEDPDPVADLFRRPFRMLVWVALFLTAGWGVCATIASFAVRGGLTLLIFGMRVRGKRGRYAPRWLCCVRALLCWLPVFGVLALASWLDAAGYVAAAGIIGAVAAVVWIALVVAAMLRPEQSIVDRLLGTRLVSR
jgi:uncharacterized RDD family membrane protein YckC/predicted Ser/Thr protein kinase